jgi:uncharacterized membrane protein YphA (DoxX/SURF4 family)
MQTLEMKSSVRTTFNLMKYVFGIVPIVAGIDKFTNLLTDWTHYISPGMLPLDPHLVMMVVGVIEIAAGILVLFRPAIGGRIVAAWLVVVAGILIASGKFLDVAVRDLVMAVGAFSLARIADAIKPAQNSFE